MHWNRKMNCSYRVLLALLSYIRGEALRSSFQYKMDFGSNTPLLTPVRIVTTAPLTITSRLPLSQVLYHLFARDSGLSSYSSPF
jgi:hypothetical protein